MVLLNLPSSNPNPYCRLCFHACELFCVLASADRNKVFAGILGALEVIKFLKHCQIQNYFSLQGCHSVFYLLACFVIECDLYPRTIPETARMLSEIDVFSSICSYNSAGKDLLYYEASAVLTVKMERTCKREADTSTLTPNFTSQGSQIYAIKSIVRIVSIRMQQQAMSNIQYTLFHACCLEAQPHS